MECAAATGITFSNDLRYTDALNPYTYRNFFNGGGVGVGDFDGDGRPDLYFTGNLVANKLYLNRGDFRFEDVTAAAGVACPDSWSTGVAVVDIDGDGDQDLYVCKAGPPAGERITGMTGVRHNELYLNNGDATFREAAAEFGLDVVGLSVHAAFFDYDGDGDLDCYLLNNSTRSTTGYNAKPGLRDIPDPNGGNKLLRNETVETGRTTFTDVTQQAGIYSSAIGFGLGVTVGDINADGHPDLFVSNDYFERDYLYVNRGDGTFAERLTDYMPEISKGSMGADFADLTGDGLPELFVTEMLPRSEVRRKTKAAFDGWNRYRLYRDQGYHQQFSRNVLQWNRGGGRFSEVGRLAGVAATDWSWGALLFDLDNDGRRDIFVANGVGKDLLDQDYINFDANPATVRRMIQEEGKTITDLIDRIPAEPLPNAVFRNAGDLTFEDVGEAYGFGQATFSNGAAYADLDDDGDLDLVVNHIDQTAGVYRNNTALPGFTLHLRARQQHNPDAIGAQVWVGGQYAELHPMRGFQSTVDKRLHFAGAPATATVRWPSGRTEDFALDPARPRHDLTEGTGTARTQVPGPTGGNSRATWPEPELRALTALTHTEDAATEFDRDPLLALGLNNEGPALGLGRPCPGPVHGYLGGAAGRPGLVFRNGKPLDRHDEMLAEDAAGENVDALWFDANGDGRDDLYVVNGSHQFSRASSALLDKLYLSGPDCALRPADQLLPLQRKFHAGSCARNHDVDGDGDQDLFVGGRLRPGLYGVPAASVLLLNDGTGSFTPARVPALDTLGMVTDARWAELDDDPDPELVVAREWGALVVLHFRGAAVARVETLPAGGGLWRTLALADLDGDGRTDIVAGNHGLNSLLTAAPGRPLELHVNDFDGNGRAEQLLTRYAADGKAYPVSLRDDVVKQLPALRKTVQRYADYGNRQLTDLFSADVLQRSVVGRVDRLASVVLLNESDGWRLSELPRAVQLAPVYAIATPDVNADGRPDLLLAGNQTVAKPELGVYAADFGTLLINDGGGRFTVAPTDLKLTGDVRGLVDDGAGGYYVARSGDTVQYLSFTTPDQ